ncbi:hypothetical protein CMQ_7798 [Grosmannia clavigera kw1407]|uniref:Lccl domain containing protein n=1 Tax=Grosmannia clavigera (strain kw1407 / UAMH 11150) TaxID=655863 RepID=F0XRZ1_GROCL|nr:uncharacterized protein CMQ_7798 [Grosmannia clavigera kw1407]EFW99430.1 hypothetical protein CMQ_7798 [Grosmannia clavigera kw1407]
MAAPDSKSIHNLNGKWQMNKTLSDPFEPVLALQGIGFLTRKAINAATLTLHITQMEAPASEALDPIADPTEKVTHVNIDQTLTGGIKGTSEMRCLDNRRRSHSDWFFGTVEGRTLWVRGPDAAAAVVKEFGDEYLGQGWPAGDDLIVSYVKNTDPNGGWVAVQVWGIKTASDGNRRYVRNIVVTKGSKRIAVQLVYDFVGERDKKADEDADLNY